MFTINTPVTIPIAKSAISPTRRNAPTPIARATKSTSRVRLSAAAAALPTAAFSEDLICDDSILMIRF